MSVWIPQDLGDNLSLIVTRDDAQDEAIMGHQAGATQPPVFPTGAFWFNQNHGSLGSAIVFSAPGAVITDLMDPKFPQLNAGGTIAWSGNQDGGSKRLTNLGAGTSDGDAVIASQTLLRDGSKSFTGNQNANGNKIINLGAPVADSDAARLVDVSAAVPEFVARFYYNTNRDVAGSGNPVRLQDTLNKPGSSTIIGSSQDFVPRRVVIRMYGVFADQDDGDAGSVTITKEYEVRRFDADASGGDPGTSGSILLETISGVGFGSDDVNVELEWRFAPSGSLGFWLRATRVAGGQMQWLRNPSNLSIDGTIHVMCEYGGN